MKIKDVHFYDDIINLPHHTSKKHPPMKKSDRAAQFGSFAALTGHSDAIAETGRLTEEKLQLTEHAIELLNLKLSLIRDKINEKPEIYLTYFKKDEKKRGGEYLKFKGRAAKINEYERKICFEDGLTVDIDDIYDIDGEIFRIYFE